MMPAPYSADLRWQVIWLFFLGVCERTVERYISKFLVNGGVKPEPVDRSYGSISFAPRHSFFLHTYTKYGNHSSFRSCNFRSTIVMRRSL